jgi:outer membrane protein assembly factor BamA
MAELEESTGTGRRQSSTALSRGRRPTALAVLVLCMLGGGGVLPASAQAQDAAVAGAEVKAVRFPGAESLADGLLLEAIAVQPTRCRSPLFVVACRLGISAALDRRYLQDSTVVAADAERLETLYEVWGFPRASVEGRIVPRGSGVVVEYHVTEGPPLLVESLVVRGLERLTPPLRIGDPLPLQEGRRYSLPRLEATEERLTRLLMEHGYPTPRIEVGGSVDDERLRARLEIDVDGGVAATFGAADVDVAPPLEEDEVRLRLAVQPGEPFRPSALERTERELYRLPIVARAVVVARVTPGERVVPVSVLVEPRRRWALDVEGTVSSTDCLEVGTFARDRYVLGAPRMLSLGLSFSNLLAKQAAGGFPCSSAGTGVYGEPDVRAELELWQPWAGNARNTVLARAFVRRESAPDVYVQRGFGGVFAFSRDLGRGAAARLSYEPERNALSAAGLYFCSNYGLCDRAEIDALSRQRWLAPVQWVGTWATPGGEPTRRTTAGHADWTTVALPRWRHGARLAVEAGAGVTGSDYAFHRGLLEVTTTRALGGGIEAAARTRIGVLGGTHELPPQLRLYSGGAETVRGAAQNLVGPKVILIDADDVPAGCEAPCDVGVIDPRRSSVRATGGSDVFEASLEARYQASALLQLAAFVDYGSVSREASSGGAIGARAEALITPGVGLRVMTDLGPIRLDVGYNPGRARRYPVFTETADGDVLRVGTGTLDPYGWDGAGSLRRFVRRLQLHMAIGQAF